jgi:hypothetical protein
VLVLGVATSFRLPPPSIPTSHHHPTPKREASARSWVATSFRLPPPSIPTSHHHSTPKRAQPLVFGVATSFWSPPPFDTHQPPPPNPETSTTAHCRGCHFFLVATSLRYPPATTTQPRNEHNRSLSGLPFLSGRHHPSIPTSHYHPTPKRATSARFRGCRLWLPPPSMRTSYHHHPPPTTLNPENEHLLLVFGVVTFLIRILLFVYKKCNIIYCTCIGTLIRRYPQYP